MKYLVKKSLWAVFSICIAGTLAFAGSPAETPKQGEASVLAKIGGKAFTEKDLEARLQDLHPEYRKMLLDPAQRRAYVESLLRVEAFARAAREEKIDELEGVKRNIDDAVNNVLAQAYFKKACPAPPDPALEELEAYYRAHKDVFQNPETVRARHILIKVSADAGEDAVTRALERAKMVRKKLDQGGSFLKLAEEYSDDPGSKQKGGDLGFFSRDKMVKPFSDAAFSLKKGETSNPVRSPYGFHIIQVEDRRPGETQDFGSAVQKIRGMLLQEKQRNCVGEVYDKLKVKYHIEIMP